MQTSSPHCKERRRRGHFTPEMDEGANSAVFSGGNCHNNSDMVENDGSDNKVAFDSCGKGTATGQMAAPLHFGSLFLERENCQQSAIQNSLCFTLRDGEKASLSKQQQSAQQEPEDSKQLQHGNHQQTSTERLSQADDEVIRTEECRANRSDPIGSEQDLIIIANNDANDQQSPRATCALSEHCREHSHQSTQFTFVIDSEAANDGIQGRKASLTKSVSDSTMTTESISAATSWNESYGSNETSVCFDNPMEDDDKELDAFCNPSARRREERRSSMTLMGAEAFQPMSALNDTRAQGLLASPITLDTSSRSSPSHLFRASMTSSTGGREAGYFDRFTYPLTKSPSTCAYDGATYLPHLDTSRSPEEGIESYLDHGKGLRTPASLQRVRACNALTKSAHSELAQWSRPSPVVEPSSKINMMSWHDFVHQHKGARSKTCEGIPRHVLPCEEDIATLRKHLEESETERIKLEEKNRELEERLKKAVKRNREAAEAVEALTDGLDPLRTSTGPPPPHVEPHFHMPSFSPGGGIISKVSPTNGTPDSLDPFQALVSHHPFDAHGQRETLSTTSSSGGFSTDSIAVDMHRLSMNFSRPIPSSAPNAPSFVPGAPLLPCPRIASRKDQSPLSSSIVSTPSPLYMSRTALDASMKSPAPYMGGCAGLSPHSTVYPSRHQGFSGSQEQHGVVSRSERSPRMTNTDSQLPAEVLVSRTLGARSQDASITLQQQLKTATPERKVAIVAALEPHVLRLSDDKHGNFLIQRAIGVDNSLAQQLHGHFVQLSLSQFGCHVVQRILDEPDYIKIVVVEELMRDRIAETLVSRNSIHVWQKILSTCWGPDYPDARRRLFSIINATMKGKWAKIACQETGSIVCQNIFESASMEEKHDCMTEILGKLKDCAANQWGVWVVQHIVEHGEDEHRKVAFQHLLDDCINLTLSPFGQKAITSALKSRDKAFVSAYVDILCEREVGHTIGNDQPGRRSVLVDIAGAPQGVQIVTTLLTSVQADQRDRIIKTVRKNSVFLKGSKAGLRVHQLCERARAFTGY